MANKELDKNILAEANALIQTLKSPGDSSRISAVLSDLKQLGGTPGLSDSAANTISGYIQSAQKILQEKTMEENTELLQSNAQSISYHPPENAFDGATFSHMTEDEKKYFTQIDPHKLYDVLKVDEHGKVVPGKAQKIKGSELREDFARIKFHALPKKEQEEIKRQEKELEDAGKPALDDSPAKHSESTYTPHYYSPSIQTDTYRPLSGYSFEKPPETKPDFIPSSLAASADLTNKPALNYSPDKDFESPKELKKLRTSLEHIEGYEAGKDMENAKEPGQIKDAEDKIRKRHDYFQRTYEKVDAMTQEFKNVDSVLEKSRTMNVYSAAQTLSDAEKRIETAREEMKKSLQDTIDYAIVKDKDPELGKDTQEGLQRAPKETAPAATATAGDLGKTVKPQNPPLISDTNAVDQIDDIRKLFESAQKEMWQVPPTIAAPTAVNDPSTRLEVADVKKQPEGPTVISVVKPSQAKETPAAQSH